MVYIFSKSKDLVNVSMFCLQSRCAKLTKQLGGLTGTQSLYSTQWWSSSSHLFSFSLHLSLFTLPLLPSLFSAWFIYLSFSPQSFSTFHFYFTFLHLLTCILSTLAVFSSVYSRDCSFQFFYISVMILICSSFLLKSAN